MKQIIFTLWRRCWIWKKNKSGICQQSHRPSKFSHLSTSFWKNISSIHVPVPYLDIKQVASPTTHFFRTPFHNFTYYFQSCKKLGKLSSDGWGKNPWNIPSANICWNPGDWTHHFPSQFFWSSRINRKNITFFKTHKSKGGSNLGKLFQRMENHMEKNMWVKLQTMEPLNWPIQICKLPQDGFIFLRRMERWW